LASNPAITVDAAKDILEAAPESAASRDDAALEALASQHGESLTSEVGSDDTDPDASAVAMLVSNAPS
jgi:hypothetical protein